MMDHRKKYAPVMRRMISLYKERLKESRNITDDPDLLIILELIDLEYLNPEAFGIDKRFGNIENVFYNGKDPVTAEGCKVFTGNKIKIKPVYMSIALVIALFIIIFVFLLRFLINQRT